MSEDGYRTDRLLSRLLNIYNPLYISSKGLLEKLDEIDVEYWERLSPRSPRVRM